MDFSKKSKLQKIGINALVDALLELASRCEAGEDFIDRLLLPQSESYKYFSTELTKLANSDRFIPWKHSMSFAQELEQLLDDIKAKVNDPEAGVNLASRFFELDEPIFERSDDSSGSIGTVFTYDAAQLFSFFAAQCQDKEWIAQKVVEIVQKDEYCVRDSLLEHVHEFLDTEQLTKLAEQFSILAADDSNDFRQRRAWSHVHTLARQLKDPEMFELARLAASSPRDSSKAHLEIAEVYLESGKPEIALSWIEKIPPEDTFVSYDRQKLLITVYGQLGKRKEQEEAVWAFFRRFRDEDNLQTLLEIVGPEKRDSIIADESVIILSEPSLCSSNLEFLVENERLQDAERYILDREDQLNGESYYSLEPIAQAFEQREFPLAASVIYRKLLESVLERRVSKYYHHGVRYLKQLDKLAKMIPDWRGRTPHSEYFQTIHDEHKRKTAFWSKYE